jgi:uncharacterized protein
MTTYHTIKTQCPCCSKEVEIRVLTSTNYFGQHTDFRRETMGFPPTQVLINTCLNCGYSGYESDFDTGIKLAANVVNKINSEIRPRLQGGEPDAGRRYEFAALIAEWQDAGADTIAELYLRAAWCCAEGDSNGDEAQYRRKAIQQFRRALDEKTIPQEGEAVVIYLVSELYRRVGETAAAKEWFDKVVERAKNDSSWKEIEIIAIQQRDQPQEMF